MRMRKIFSAVLALSVICGGAAPFAAEMPEYTLTANAVDVVDSGKCGDNLTWELDSEGTLTISGTGEMYGLPLQIDQFSDALWYDSTTVKRSDIKNVIINEGVINVGAAAFYRCSNLKKANLPNGLVSIDYAAFGGSGLEEINIPDSLESIGSRDTYIEGGVGTIGDGAFDGTPWLEEKIKANKIVVVNNCLIYCYGWGYFSPVTVEDGDESYKRVVIPDGVKVIAEYVFGVPNFMGSPVEDITIPGSIKSINHSMFGSSSFRNVTIKNGVERIEDRAFVECILKEVTIPESVSYIGYHAFGPHEVSIDWGDETPIELKKITILNPNCELNQIIETDSESPDRYSGVICGYEGSTAQKFATEHDLAFESLGAAPTNTATESGDLNDDGKIDATDATLVLVNYSLLSTGEKIQLTESQQKAADVNGDGKIDASDATMILQYYSYLSTGGKDSFADFLKK
ncbi:leucine-rich repeat protein [Ruminococcus sp. XPD3002]|uniref:leucine-rich repeat protein n=1 Tax=Ruminococcus sp. XPD3002 TaxID=1452269 RepID=UPI00092397DD|nr:Dockerin type I repeat-containing protein [Ruminococcus flavefaciens]